MAENFTFTPANSSASSIIDLTSTDINPGAAPTSTPRQGGFTLRNRINFTNVSTTNSKLFNMTASSASNAQGSYVLRVLEVPERVMVKDVQIFAVRDETVPGSAAVGSNAGLHASHLTTLAIGIGVETRSVPLDNSSYSGLTDLDIQASAQRGMGAGAQFGEIALEAAGASVDGCGFTASQVEAVDSSMSNAQFARVVTEVAGTGSAIEHAQPSYFPLGGYVYLGTTIAATGSASLSSISKIGSTYVHLTGTWEIQADCTYMPE